MSEETKEISLREAFKIGDIVKEWGNKGWIYAGLSEDPKNPEDPKNADSPKS